jgi:tetratricopeptide (TPR) repeat protein
MTVVCGHLAKPDDALDVAIAAFGDMIRKQPKADVVINQRGNIYMRKGDTTRAIADYTRAMKLRPGDFWAYALRGNAYQTIGKRQQAIADYRAAIARHPTGDTLKQIQAALKELGA